MGHPTVYPTGVTLYHPEKCWNGFTVFPCPNRGALLIDMNGNERHLWKDLQGFPNKILPGGFVMGSRGVRNPRYGLQDQLDLVQVDFDGNITWKFDHAEFIEDPGEVPQWMARQHHDFQREGNPVGYYAPGMLPGTDRGNTLILSHKDVHVPYISALPLVDDIIYEVDWEGNIVWEWLCSDHVEEMDFLEEARNAMARDPNMRGGDTFDAAPEIGDWMHINSMSVLGPNRWYDQGDERFHPDNIICDGRETNIIFIICKKTGKIVWQIGPNYYEKHLRHLGWIIGQHHAHMIPRNLPGEGNILVFDNGGWGGYGAPNPASRTGHNHATRDWSRVLEINPQTLQIVWKYTPAEAGFAVPLDAYRFYSPFISSAQRLPNGNTLITEGSDGRVFEVTPEHEIVWEYINPYWGTGALALNMIYRAYRVPYEWVPQLEKLPEVPIEKVDNAHFRMPGAGDSAHLTEVSVDGTQTDAPQGGHCVALIGD